MTSLAEGVVLTLKTSAILKFSGPCLGFKRRLPLKNHKSRCNVYNVLLVNNSSHQDTHHPDESLMCSTIRSHVSLTSTLRGHLLHTLKPGPALGVVLNCADSAQERAARSHQPKPRGQNLILCFGKQTLTENTSFRERIHLFSSSLPQTRPRG